MRLSVRFTLLILLFFLFVLFFFTSIYQSDQSRETIFLYLSNNVLYDLSLYSSEYYHTSFLTFENHEYVLITPCKNMTFFVPSMSYFLSFNGSKRSIYATLLFAPGFSTASLFDNLSSAFSSCKAIRETFFPPISGSCIKRGIRIEQYILLPQNIAIILAQPTDNSIFLLADVKYFERNNSVVFNHLCKITLTNQINSKA